MRISSIQLHQQGIESFTTQQDKLAVLQKQISSGMRITRPSDDPVASSRILELEQTVSLLEQYNSNASLAENRLRLEETTLSALENSYYRIKELSIQANSSVNDSVSLNAIKSEINERFDELFSLANTQDSSGEYLFAGMQNQNESFTKNTTGSISHVVFNGDQGQRSFQISQTRQIRADDSGSEIFMEIPSGHGLITDANSAGGSISPALVIETTAFTAGINYEIRFTGANTYDVVDLAAPVPAIVSGAAYTDSANIEFAGIRASITGTPAMGDTFTVSPGQYRDIFQTMEVFKVALSNTSPTRSDNLDSIQADMDAFFQNILNTRTSIGGRLNAVTTQMDDNSAFILTTQKTLGTLRDTDLAEAISQLTLEQTTLDAALSSFAKISSSSLFNFLR
jgi:flagellar hook-associated protein 3 FlgL